MIKMLTESVNSLKFRVDGMRNSQIIDKKENYPGFKGSINMKMLRDWHHMLCNQG